MKVWGDVASEDAFKNVFGKLPIMHANIKNCSGGNDTVESNRGKVGAAKKLLRKRPTGMLKATRGNRCGLWMHLRTRMWRGRT